jgi:hypothetical protein
MSDKTGCGKQSQRFSTACFYAAEIDNIYIYYFISGKEYN